MMKAILGLILLFYCVTSGLCGSVSRGEFSEVKLFLAPAAFDVETAVALNDLALKEKEVGYQLRAALALRPRWTNHDSSEALLQFNLLNPKLYLRGKSLEASFRKFDSIWDSYSDTEFYVHWKNGMIQTAYLDPTEPVDILNYKKSIISLFQFQIIDGEYNETDISGTCSVLYDSVSTDVFRKIKRGCVAPGAAAAWDRGLSARRVTRYTLGAAPRVLRELFADELLRLGELAGVKARSWHRLTAAAAPPPAARAADLAAALRALPPTHAPAPLALAGDDAPDDDEEAGAALAASAEALREEAAGAGGAAGQARAALRLLPALRAAPLAGLRALLRDDLPYDTLIGTCRMLGLAGTRATHAAADAFLHLGARDPLRPLALAYLAAFAQAAEPHAAAVADVARLAADARDPAVADAALLAASAAAVRLPAPDAGDAADSADLARTLRDDIARALPRCKEEACRAVKLQALGHLRREDSAELLLEHAERGERAAALAALDALAALPPRALHFARRRRLERLALLPGPALEVRAAALDLLVRSSAARPLPLAETALALHYAGPVELRRLFWQRFAALAEESPEARDVVARLPVELRAWPAQAHAGTSLALTRSTGWRAGAWAARLDALQAAAAGLLRRGRVALLAVAPDNSTHDLLTVDVWTRGLQAVAGGAAPDPLLRERADGEDHVAGGLALAVAGVSLPPVSLFEGQAELLGHVWAGTGSAPTPVLRAARATAPVRVRAPLAGGARATLRWAAAGALALDAHAAVSLWSRSAAARLELRAAGAARGEASLRTAWARLRAESRAEAEPRLRVSADLDFYDAVALCVRVSVADHDLRFVSHRSSSQGERPLRVSHWRNATLPTPGRTLALGRAPAAACVALPPAADD